MKRAVSPGAGKYGSQIVVARLSASWNPCCQSVPSDSPRASRTSGMPGTAESTSLRRRERTEPRTGSADLLPQGHRDPWICLYGSPRHAHAVPHGAMPHLDTNA